MEVTRTFAHRTVAFAAAAVLILTGVNAQAATGASRNGGDPSKSSARADADAQKCKKKKKCKKEDGGFVPGRVIEIEYTGSAIGSTDSPATVYPFGPLFPVNFIPGQGEVLAMIEIVDAVGPNASAGFSYDSDGDGFNDTSFDVCGSTEEPAVVIPGMQYNIFPYLLPSSSCTDAIATTGTITVTFNKV